MSNIERIIPIPYAERLLTLIAESDIDLSKSEAMAYGILTDHVWHDTLPSTPIPRQLVVLCVTSLEDALERAGVHLPEG